MLLLCHMNVIKTYLSVAAVVVLAGNCFSQTATKPEKVSHAEPLYLDLVRDLGARKGEKEFNAAFDFTKFKNFNEQSFLVEYEFAPINRVGFEVEVDFSFFRRTADNASAPNSKIESLRFSTQYSFFVSTKLKTTLAVGYTQIFELADFKDYKKTSLVTGAVYNPFFVAAKRWGDHFNTLVYAYPLLEHDFATNRLDLDWEINTSFLFTIPQTKHFVGVELNKEFRDGKFDMTIRPQAKIRVSQQVALGFVTGIPTKKKDEGMSSFLRIIYEP